MNMYRMKEQMIAESRKYIDEQIAALRKELISGQGKDSKDTGKAKESSKGKAKAETGAISKANSKA